MKDIERVIKKAGSLRKAAKKLGINPPFLSQVRLGKLPISFDLAIRLEQHFGIDARDLITRQLWERFAIYRACKAKEARATNDSLRFRRDFQ